MAEWDQILYRKILNESGILYDKDSSNNYMTIKDVTQYLESIAPLRFQEDYDNSGLIVGDPSTQVTGILISLDAIESVIDDAIAQGCNLIVSHHPIVFRGIKKFDPTSYVNRCIIKAIKHDIGLYSIHTNLDNVLSSGVNQRICQQLGLRDVSLLKPQRKHRHEKDYVVGSGCIGELPEGIEELTFLSFVKDKMKTGIIRHTSLSGQKVEKIAVCGGSGSFLLSSAIAAEADVFITADFKYHEFFDADGKIIICDIGHYESEQYTIDLLAELLRKKFPTFALHFTQVNTNPVQYF